MEKVSKKQTVALMHEQLHREEIKIKMIQQLVIDHAKFDDSDFGAPREIRENSDTSSAKRTFSSVMGSSLDE